MTKLVETKLGVMSVGDVIVAILCGVPVADLRPGNGETTNE